MPTRRRRSVSANHGGTGGSQTHAAWNLSVYGVRQLGGRRPPLYGGVGLMVQGKFTGVQQGPQEVAGGLASVAFLGEELGPLLTLRGSRTAGERGQAELFGNLGLRASLERLGEQGGVGRIELPGIHKPQGLRNASLILDRVGSLVEAEEGDEGRARAVVARGLLVLGGASGVAALAGAKDHHERVV